MTSTHAVDPDNELWHHEIQSPVGPLTIVAGADAVVGLYHEGHSPAPAPARLGHRIVCNHLPVRGIPPAPGGRAAAPTAGMVDPLLPEAPAPPARTVDLLFRAARELGEYFARSRHAFGTPIELHGTDFQRLVWAELRAIPYGERRSYRDIAARLGNPAMGRAIGAAVRSNPVSILVPGHRVVSRTGAVIGYAAGTDVKRALLELEAGSGDGSGPAPVQDVQP
ncbi:methylated-DNA--[protein]-cysteine S-methyltransferase [Arthrobacter sp. TMS1-12-1]